MSSAGVLLLIAVPFVGLVVLVLLMNRWGSKHDPMKRTRFEWLTPRGARNRRQSGRD